MDRWTVEMVEERLVEAAGVMKRLPEVKVPGYFSTWPKIVHDFADRVEQEPEPLSRPRPSPEAISRMEQALDWLGWLEPVDAKIVWSRAEGTAWKMICYRFAISRATAHRRWQYALSVIAWQLNDKRPPMKRSRRFVVERARQLSS
jgi:hypothetical protein